MRWEAGLARDAAESQDVRIEDEDLDGKTEAVELREALQHPQDLSLKICEELDAYQTKRTR